MKNLKAEIEAGSRLVIAEIGINHDGDIDVAMELIQRASNSGCRAIKFQYRNLERAYGSVFEIGDEIIKTEIQKNYISPNNLIYLNKFAQNLGLQVGISFFTIEDLADFGSQIDEFDFFKVPSVEHQNSELINSLCSIDSQKMVLVATGMATEKSIEESFSRIEHDNWIPLHCVSNYPVEFFNAQLGYIPTLASRWKRPVGYSSHDSNWAMCLLALAQGAQIIERHITLSKDSKGLDHTSSSTADELRLLCEIVNNYWDCMRPVSTRTANQGEKLNRQNLGRSLYSKREIKAGELFKSEDFSYLSPQTGLSPTEFDVVKNLTFIRGVSKGAVLTKNHFSKNFELSPKHQSFAEEFRISLPVRLHDFLQIKKSFGISNFEFHLSYKELGQKIPSIPNLSGNLFTIHLPDYCSSNSIIDPFSSDLMVRTESLRLINNAIDFAKNLEDQTGSEVEIVGSFSKHTGFAPDFYCQFEEFLSTFIAGRAKLSLQWLPPIAWYFGGSVRLDVMNNIEAANRILETKLPVVMDTSHLFLGSEYFGFNASSLFSDLLPQTSWFHISAASGIDGEGDNFLSMSPEQAELIKLVLYTKKPKVIEVWQGHLNDFEGFHLAIRDLYSLTKAGNEL